MRGKRQTFFAITVTVALVASVAFFLCGCDTGVKKRPYGWLHLGRTSELTAPELEFPSLGLLLRQDEGGYYVMSTLCTTDLSPLMRKPGARGEPILVAENGSAYSLAGDVLHGPAKAALPYYELRLDRSSYDGPFDMIYAYIGMEKPRSYRLKLR